MKREREREREREKSAKPMFCEKSKFVIFPKVEEVSESAGDEFAQFVKVFFSFLSLFLMICSTINKTNQLFPICNN